MPEQPSQFLNRVYACQTNSCVRTFVSACAGGVPERDRDLPGHGASMGPVTSLLAALCILIGMSAASPALPARPVTAITPINLSTESSGGQHPVMKLDAIGNVD